jgi:signal transduction histidine kinase
VEAHLGKTNAEIGMPAELVLQFERKCRAASATGEEMQLEFSFPAPEGTRHYRARFVPESPSDDPAGTLLCVMYDVTGRVRAEQERRTLLDALAHDLKNPLAALRVHAQLERRRLARRGVPEVAELDARLAGFEGLSNRMTELVDELADHARLALGDAVELALEPVDMEEIVRLAAEEAVPAPHADRVVLSCQPGLIGTWDRQRLRRIVANLLGNAVKYSPAGGEIVVRTGKNGAHAFLQVIDHGIGIPAADLPHVFNLRHRAGNVGGIPGSGIGLAGVKQIVQQHEGTIEVDSEEGRGTVVTVRLPIEPAGALSS